ncbi:MAG: hydroxyacid dehydrogenase [Myxococcales bacterium]|nr:hydroxyacid dehydrogenase [Myxococcales bacterium]
MRVLIADKFSQQGVATLEGIVDEVIYRPDLGADTLPDAVKDAGASILIVRSTKVNADTLAASDALSLVIRAGAGVNTIDLAAASKRGIFVANCPGKNAIAVAELTMGMILALDRRIVDATLELRQGSWNKARYGKARGIKGQTLGLVGFGMIAREVAQRARNFGVKLQAFDRAPIDPELAEAHGVTPVSSLADLLRTSDIVSIHVPYGASTHHMIGRDELALMKKDALLIHTARGGVVDDAALAEAVASGRIRAGLDVFEEEPAASKAEFSGPLRGLDGVYATPHIAASTDQAEGAIADEVIRIVHDYLAKGLVHNTVNIVSDRVSRFRLIIRHLDQVGVLAGILSALRSESLNVQEMQNIIFARGEAACATITLEHRPSELLLGRLRDQETILAVELRATGAVA